MNIYIYVHTYAYKILMNKEAINFKSQGGIYEIWKKKSLWEMHAYLIIFKNWEIKILIFL